MENPPDHLEIDHGLFPLATVCFHCTVLVLKANEGDILQDYLPVHFSILYNRITMVLNETHPKSDKHTEFVFIKG